MRKTLDEHIKRIKELSLIKEAEELEISDEVIDNNLEKILQDTLKNIGTLGKTVGNRDGDLDLANQNNESIQLTEAGLGMLAAGTALAAPMIINMIGKGVRQLGKTAKSERITNIGQKVSDSGKKLHHKYESTIVNILKKYYPNKTEEFYKGAATAILVSATVALGISSVTTAISAAQAGNAGLAAVEGGLSGVKGVEIFNAAKAMLPNILNGFIK